MKVFADLHHTDLYYSLHLLFEERLGWELYRPIGFDWFNAGYWKIAEPYNNAMDTVGQYLDTGAGKWDQFKRLNGEHYIEENIYRVYDPSHDYYQRAITLETFKSMQFDVIMPTIVSHDLPFTNLRNKFQAKAQLVAQMGNINQRTTLQHVLYSVPYSPPATQNALHYHQEIDRKLYQYINPNPDTKNVYSMVNLLPDAGTYHQYKNQMSDCNFKAHGAGCPDGALPGCKGVSKAMQEANIGWHIKPGDGFGHTAMGWFASGRPVITKMKDVVKYGLDAPHLFEPGVTCIDLESRPLHANCDLIRKCLKPEENQRLAQNAFQRFNEVVNYDVEEQKIRKFFEKVL